METKPAVMFSVRERSPSTRGGIVAVLAAVLIMMPGMLPAQRISDLGAYMIISIPTLELDDGVGIGIYIVVLVIDKKTKGYIRAGYDYFKATTNQNSFSLPDYSRHYVYTSLVMHRKVGYAFYPFVEVGGGYMFHRLWEKYYGSIRGLQREKYDNGAAGHFGAGLRVRMMNRMWVNFSVRWFQIDTKKTVVSGTTRTSESLLWKQSEVLWSISIWL